MTAPPKLPWISLVLLLVTYTTFGWLLADWTNNRVIWLAVAFGTTILAGCVTYPSRSVNMGFGGLFKTDVKAFILILVASIASILLVAWIQLFVDLVILAAAGLLVSLDLKTGGWSKPFSLVLIIGWQLLGISMGLWLHYLYFHPLAGLPEYFYLTYWLQRFVPTTR